MAQNLAPNIQLGAVHELRMERASRMPCCCTLMRQLSRCFSRSSLPNPTSSDYLTPLQIYDEARKFTYQTGVRPVVVYGGAPQQQQVQGLYPACCAAPYPSLAIHVPLPPVFCFGL